MPLPTPPPSRLSDLGNPSSVGFLIAEERGTDLWRRSKDGGGAADGRTWAAASRATKAALVDKYFATGAEGI